MAYNTKKILRDRNGDPIPQSYDSYGDRYVPSEIDARLKAIENQQQEILERLDGEFDTRLTGSIVELFKSDSIEVDANSVVNLITITKMKKKNVFASVRAGQSHSFLVDVDWRTSATGSQGYSVGSEELANAENSLTSKSETHKLVKSNIARFRLENQSDEPQRYLSIVILGVD